MQINTKVQIVMDQSAIEAAIVAALYQKLPHLAGTEFSIKLVAGRGDAGHRAEIEAIHAVDASLGIVAPEELVEPASPEEVIKEVEAKITDTKEEDEAPFAEAEPSAEVSDPAPQEEAVPPVEQQPRPIFRANGPKEEAQPEPAAEEAPPAAPTPGKLFGRLGRPANK